MNPRPTWDEVSAGEPEFATVLGSDALEERQALWRRRFAEGMYGSVPAPPLALDVRIDPIPGTSAKRLTIVVKGSGGAFEVDAALWLPSGDGPWPLIAGLGFLGPVGILPDGCFPIDTQARVYKQLEWGAPANRLHPSLAGKEANRWPVGTLCDAGYAVLISCYGSWAPDDPIAINEYGLRPTLGTDTGAISLWAWALMRLLDAAEQLDCIDMQRTVVAGHSRLAKAALWAGVNDRRIQAVFANNAGCGGTSPEAHPFGETLAQMARQFPHWIPSWQGDLDLDQHHLMACLAPRRLYVASAEEDIWADPVGTYEAIRAASAAWGTKGAWQDGHAVWENGATVDHPHLGHHIRPGNHEILDVDWEAFLTFLEQPR